MARWGGDLLLSRLLCLLFVCQQASAKPLSSISERLVFEFQPAHEAFSRFLQSRSQSIPSSLSQTEAIEYAKKHLLFDEFIASPEFFKLLQDLDSPINLYTSTSSVSPKRTRFSALPFVLVNIQSVSNCMLELKATTTADDRRRQSSEEYASYMNGGKTSGVALVTTFRLRLNKLTHVRCAAPNIGGIELLFEKAEDGTHDDGELQINSAVLRGHDKKVAHGQHSINKQHFLKTIAQAVPDVLVCAKPEWIRRVTHRSVSVLLYDYLHWWLEHKPDCSTTSSLARPTVHSDPQPLGGATQFLTKMADISKLLESRGAYKQKTPATSATTGELVPVRKVRGSPPASVTITDEENEVERSVSKVVFHHEHRGEEEDTGSPDGGQESGTTPSARTKIQSAQIDDTAEPEPEE